MSPANGDMERARRPWFRDHGLLLANLILFAIFFGGMILSGAAAYDADQVRHGQPATGLLAYLASSDFVEATFENWESEFLQMGAYVVLTAHLFMRGSSESKPSDQAAEQDEDPAGHRDDPDAPWPVRRGGWWLWVYERSLAILFGVLFLGSMLAHALGGSAAYNEVLSEHGLPELSWWAYLGTAQFWFESFQNWQSEFLAVAVIVGASVYLRHRGSAESKPVAAPHSATGG